MAIGIGTGTTVVFTTAGNAGVVTSFNIDGEEVSVIDASGLATTGYRLKLFGSLIEPPALSVDIVYDPADPPVIGAADDVTVTWPDTSTLVGTGAFISRSSETPLEDKMTASFVFQFDGATGPTYA